MGCAPAGDEPPSGEPVSAWRVDRWRVSNVEGGVCLVLRDAASPAERARAWRPAEAASQVDTWFAVGAPGVAYGACFEVAARVGAGLVVDAARAREVVREALRSGAVIAFRDAREDAHATAPETPEEVMPAPAPREERAWITIELVTNDDPPKPVAFARYRIKLPDESVREGRLNAVGVAHFEDLDPGMCEVTFPDYDGGSWDRLG